MKPELVVSGITDENTLACLSRARKYTQYCKAVENALAGKCPFCHVDPEYNKIILETDDWMVWACNPPEKHTKHHFLFVPRVHVTSVSDLGVPQRIDLFDLIDEVKVMCSISSCGILIRDGDARLSAGTIQHLHVHMMVPDGTGRVESPFYKGDASEAEGFARAIIFEKMRTGTPFTGLEPCEQELIKDRL